MKNYYTSNTLNKEGYSSGGSLMPDRNFFPSKYAYSINGQRNEADGANVHLGLLTSDYTSAEFWEYDSRALRRWDTDPIEVPSISPYACFNNNPLYFVDINGAQPKPNVRRHSLKAWILDGFQKGSHWEHGRIDKNPSQTNTHHASVNVYFRMPTSSIVMPPLMSTSPILNRALTFNLTSGQYLLNPNIPTSTVNNFLSNPRFTFANFQVDNMDYLPNDIGGTSTYTFTDAFNGLPTNASATGAGIRTTPIGNSIPNLTTNTTVNLNVNATPLTVNDGCQYFMIRGRAQYTYITRVRAQNFKNWLRRVRNRHG